MGYNGDKGRAAYVHRACKLLIISVTATAAGKHFYYKTEAEIHTVTIYYTCIHKQSHGCNISVIAVSGSITGT